MLPLPRPAAAYRSSASIRSCKAAMEACMFSTARSMGGRVDPESEELEARGAVDVGMGERAVCGVRPGTKDRGKEVVLMKGGLLYGS